MHVVPRRFDRARIRRTTRRTGVEALLAFAWAALCNLAIELLQSSGGFTFALKPALFLLGSLLLWVAMVAVWALTGRLRVAAAALVVVTVLIGYANHVKMVLRREPLYPDDFAIAPHAGFLEEMVGGGTVAAVAAVTVLLAALALVVGWRWRKRHPRPPREGRRTLVRALVVRLVVATLAVGTLVYAAGFNQPGNAVRAAYRLGDAEWASWSQEKNYTYNGFVGGMLYNLDVPVMKKPDDYSRATMEQIAARYVAAAQTTNATRSPTALDGVNIVVVLSESFSDPTMLDGIELDEDPIPYTRSLMEQTTSGQMLAQRYGSGTANMEFETLTGMSTSQFDPRLMTPYQMLVPRYDQFPSFVGLTRAWGYDRVAVHPYDTYMYRRESVYPILGFQDFVDRREMTVRKRIQGSPFISDNSAFTEVQHQIDTHDKPLLTHLVTMQNHFPMADSYDAPMTVRGADGSTEDDAEAYLRGLSFSDRALRKFLTTLSESDEKTAVLFFGDHLPPVWPDHVAEENGPVGMRETPFLMWSNFLTFNNPQPVTSPVFLLPLLMDQLGAPLPPYYQLLLQLHAQIPAMRAGQLYDGEGSRLDPDELAPEAQQLLHDYRLVQYDLSVGQRWSQDAMLYPRSTEDQPASAASE
ncbi:LTA synthase family protein [Nocardioides iriomotensis]|uniref:LTA synthase family protein n=1 Tax=Nocardioides iriomotensis TaxID=715784 RepID=A0A4Q5IXG6_9ACTN|nr:LTA synthase family protein [Nocardioides iriomotensis]RYU09609.1 LTA synthase family protein [Nocardioides iriomotensis]